MIRTLLAALVLAATAPALAAAEIVSASPDHYRLHHSAEVPHPPGVVWDRLVDPARWWHPDHTYSGDAANLSLDLRPGGAWAETWAEGAVEHGRVLMVRKGEMLRLDAPFGPLQELGVTVIWTITLAPGEAGGTVIGFTEVASGTPASGLDALAPAVDGVKAEALRRLAQVPADQRP